MDLGWFELVPSSPNHEIGFTNFPVNPGDSISASVFYSTTNDWVTQIDDLTTGREGEFVVGYYWDVSDIGYNDGVIQGTAYATSYAGGSSAEWIVEDPYSAATSSYLPFANYGVVTFTNLAAMITSWSLPGSNAWALSQGSQILSMPSPVNGDSFTCTYKGISVFAATRGASLAAGDRSSSAPGGDFVAIPSSGNGSGSGKVVATQVPASPSTFPLRK